MKKALIIIILIAQSLLLHAQSFYCKSIGISEGLSQSSVTSVIYDRKGSLWVGTRYGLNEYQGGQVRTIPGDILEGDYINFLYTDTQDNLWVSTDKGLSLYHSFTDSFTRHLNEICYSALDREEETVFGSDNGIISYNHKDGTFTHTPQEGSYVIGLFDYKGQLLIVDRGLGVFLGSFQNHLNIPAINETVIMASVLSGNNLYLATFRSGLISINLDDLGTKIFKSENSGLSYDVILSLMLDDRLLWMGTDGGGICIMDTASEAICRFTEYFKHHIGTLPDNSVTTLYKDPHGNVWVGSVRNGLCGLKETSIKSLEARGPGSSQNLSHNVVNTLYEDKDGFVWIGTDGGGLNCYNPLDGSVRVIDSMKDEKVVSICDYDSSNLLISLYSRGYCLLNKINGRRTPFLIVNARTNAEECYFGNSPGNYSLGDGRILILAIHLYIYDRNTGQFTLLERDPTIPVSGMTVIGDDRQGKVYALSSLGLFEIDTAAYSARCILRQGGINTASYISGGIWIGTDSGVKRMDIATGDIFDFKTSLFRRVTQLCPDSANHALWIAADNSLFRYKSGRFEQHGENEGFAPNEILCSASSRLNKVVYLGGTKGMVEINTDTQKNTEQIKHIALHQVTVKGSRLSAAEGKLTLPHNYSILNLTVNQIGSDPFEKVLYRYVVDGANSSVIETYDNNIQLPSLTSGKYDIKVSYLMNSGEWSPEDKLISIRIKQPWHKSLPFNIFIISLVLIALICAFFYIYKRRIQLYEMERQAKDIGFIHKLDDFIESNISNSDLDVLAMSKDFAMSRAALYNKVKASTGKAVAEYIMEKRMDTAKDLLENSNLSITEISERVGFSSPKYFSTRFKIKTGDSPLAYRKSHR